mgnify:CR=1 FL=1
MYIGKIIKNNLGSEWVILSIVGKKLTLESVSNSEILVVYESSAKRGDFLGKFDKTVHGIGCNGYISKPFTKKDKMCWRDMILRCLSNKGTENCASYLSIKVSEDFLVFSKFLDWLHEQKPYSLIGDWQLDKDLFFNGYYSKESCCILPREVNLSLIGIRSTRSNTGLTGVSFCKREKTYVAKIHKFGVHYNLGSFKSPIDAYNTWKEAKLAHLQELAEKYKTY